MLKCSSSEASSFHNDQLKFLNKSSKNIKVTNEQTGDLDKDKNTSEAEKHLLDSAE